MGETSTFPWRLFSVDHGDKDGEAVCFTFAKLPENNNLEAFKQLAERYETITPEEIKGAGGVIKTAWYLTGFGSTMTCSLCKAAMKRNSSGIRGCLRCLWVIVRKEACMNTQGYEELVRANNLQELLDAFRYRAKIMRETIAKYEAMINPPRPKSKWTKFKELIQRGIDKWKKWA